MSDLDQAATAAAPPDARDAPGPAGRLHVRELRHPTEPSRFALALVASSATVAIAVFVLVSLGRTPTLLYVLLGIVVVFLLLWLALQLWRVRLLADGVKVSAETLPRVQDAVDTVRERLDYTARVDVFVVDKIGPVMGTNAAPVTLTSFFGVHVIVAEGSAIGALDDEQERRRLVFLLATFVGALKARHTRWSPFLMALQMSGLPKLVFLFVYPWYRATVYTGDRIAYACCGDLDVSLQAVYRLLVGKDVAAHLRADGLVGQALTVRRNPVLRLAQLLRPVPHASNRYLDLLSFAGGREPAAFRAFRDGLSPQRAGLDDVVGRLGRRRPATWATPLGVVLAVSLLATAFVAGQGNQDSVLARAIAAGFGGESADADPPQPEPPPTPTPTPPPTAMSDPAAVTMLVAALPADQRDTCLAAPSDPGSGLVVAVDCSAAASSGPAQVSYFVYDDADAMSAAHEAATSGLAEGDCAVGEGKGTWNHRGVERGPLACYTAATGEATVLWGETDSAVLAWARDADMSGSEMFEWWRDNAVLGF